MAVYSCTVIDPINYKGIYNCPSSRVRVELKFLVLKTPSIILVFSSVGRDVCSLFHTRPRKKTGHQAAGCGCGGPQGLTRASRDLTERIPTPIQKLNGTCIFTYMNG